MTGAVFMKFGRAPTTESTWRISRMDADGRAAGPAAPSAMCLFSSIRRGFSTLRPMSASTPATTTSFDERIASRTARIGIVGLGYAGLPLAMAFAEAGFEVTGIDLSDE